jgi:glycosyltransferase involved in cell wall biosynthesis
MLRIAMTALSNPKSDPRRPLASIIVPCKGRLHHLRRTLPNMLAQRCEFPYEVIVVDFDCPQGTFDWCRELNVRNLVALKVVDGAKLFNHSRSRNCGASLGQGAVLAFVDADVRMAPEWLRKATRPICTGSAGLVTVGSGSAKGCQCCGTFAISAELFHTLRGYDEALQGWNSEDLDLYGRAEQRARRARYGGGLVTSIEHDNSERVRFQTEKDVWVSNTANRSYLARRTGTVNAAGYGQGEFLVFRGHGDELPPIVWPERKRVVRPVRRTLERSLGRLQVAGL